MVKYINLNHNIGRIIGWVCYFLYQTMETMECSGVKGKKHDLVMTRDEQNITLEMFKKCFDLEILK